jgi:hypothetical protein
MEKFSTHNEKEINISGTSLVGYVNTTYSKLFEKFGKPFDNGYKTDAEWKIEFSDGKVAAIYNWKNGKKYNGSKGLDLDDITVWHIGGFDNSVVERIQKILN